MKSKTLTVAFAVVLLLVTVRAAGVSAQQPVLERKTLLGGKVSLLMPSDFAPMGEELMRRKYPSSYRPGLVFTNKATTINVALDHTVHALPANQLAAAYESMRSAMKNMHPSAAWFRQEIRRINGREFFLLELRTPAIDTEIRNIMVGTSLDDRLLMITFNVTKALETQWLPTGNKIIESIAVQ
jgi:hypothetical protein